MHEAYMLRCLELAKLGAGYVAPNPMVGAVLVYEGRIIGEGFHRQYGQAHAEVNCINSVAEADKHFIPQADLYVSLEPCAHYGKTPPCTGLIIRNHIKRVFVGSRDPFDSVNGKGIEQLRQAGVEVFENILETECRKLNERFFWFHENRKPFITLKWAQTANGIIGNKNNERLLISNAAVNRQVHRWRSEAMAIIIGANTAEKDNPSLTNRLYSGKHPLRILIDPSLRCSTALTVFNDGMPTVVINHQYSKTEGAVTYVKADGDCINTLVEYCVQNNIQSILVEGGATTLQHFIDKGLWNEAQIIISTSLSADDGIHAPCLNQAQLKSKKTYSDNEVYCFINTQHSS